MGASIRIKGITKFVLGMVTGAGAIYLLLWLQTREVTANAITMVILGIPIAIGLSGLLEALMNRPFSEMETWWMSLKGWQRGILGITIVITAFAVIFGAFTTAVSLKLL